jgi:hypothetical protein
VLGTTITRPRRSATSPNLEVRRCVQIVVTNTDYKRSRNNNIAEREGETLIGLIVIRVGYKRSRISDTAELEGETLGSDCCRLL